MHANTHLLLSNDGVRSADNISLRRRLSTLATKYVHGCWRGKHGNVMVVVRAQKQKRWGGSKFHQGLHIARVNRE